MWSANNDRQRFPWLDVVFHSKAVLRLAKEFGALKGKSSKDKGKKRRGQGSLDNYFSSQQAMSQSDPFVESQDS